ncbi:hypothetical protein ElyMa_006820200 [Elysia marginata]|uniref:Uncharacterized protein n=1 Tax=Elysia marginata TaxID=1093978 RepID=A0AAV4J4Q0_9GAST|nr:hypothetical protein ElyMa_006820200 [Elysia marginata]
MVSLRLSAVQAVQLLPLLTLWPVLTMAAPTQHEETEWKLIGRAKNDDDLTGDFMALSDDVIIDALFTNLDTLQDELEICEESLREKLLGKYDRDSEMASNDFVYDPDNVLSKYARLETFPNFTTIVNSDSRPGSLSNKVVVNEANTDNFPSVSNRNHSGNDSLINVSNNSNTEDFGSDTNDSNNNNRTTIASASHSAHYSKAKVLDFGDDVVLQAAWDDIETDTPPPPSTQTNTYTPTTVKSDISDSTAPTTNEIDTSTLSTTKSDMTSSSTTTSDMPSSSSTTKSDMPSSSTTKSDMPSSSTNKKDMPSSSTATSDMLTATTIKDYTRPPTVNKSDMPLPTTIESTKAVPTVAKSDLFTTASLTETHHLYTTRATPPGTEGVTQEEASSIHSTLTKTVLEIHDDVVPQMSREGDPRELPPESVASDKLSPEVSRSDAKHADTTQATRQAQEHLTQDKDSSVQNTVTKTVHLPQEGSISRRSLQSTSKNKGSDEQRHLTKRSARDPLKPTALVVSKLSKRINQLKRWIVDCHIMYKMLK